MTEEEIKLVAEMLAKIGGNWYPERAQSAPRAVNNRHREVARIIIEAVDRSQAADRAAEGSPPPEGPRDVAAPNEIESGELHVGASVLYRPPGDKRMLACRVEQLEGGRAYVVPELREIGWVSTHSLLPLKPIRDNGPRPSRPPSAVLPGAVNLKDANPLASTIEAIPLSPEQLKVVEPSAGVIHYFSSIGEWIAFRRSATDRYLFDRKGNWIGWFPWDEKEIVNIDGQYLGTVVYGDRIYRRVSPAPESREAGFVMDPGSARYAGYPGYAAHLAPPYGFKDLDMARIPSGTRPWLRGYDPDAAGRRSMFEIWMSKIGLGRLAHAIEGMIRRIS